MKSVLFVCTGNYYRSRFAEIVFNYYARQNGLAYRAFSRGLRLNPEKNKGVISPHTISFLNVLSIDQRQAGAPVKLSHADLKTADLVIVLDEKEHRPMIKKNFPEWEEKVEYWNFEDDYIVSPDKVLPLLKQKVEQLLHELHAR